MVRPCRLKSLASVAVVVGVVLGLLAAPASGSTARLIDVVFSPECKYLPPGVPCLPGSAKALVYQAGRGEANRASLSGGPEQFRIRDAGAVIEPGAGCLATDGHGVSCSAPAGALRVFVATGSGADTVRLALAGQVIVDGGAGDDVLLGGRGGDKLFGGKGADVLRGGDGADGLYDASLRRPLRSGDPDPFDQQTVLALAAPGRGGDSFVGGKGSDSISYEGRSASVRVDLADTAAVGGTGLEHDSARGLESAFGGAGDDRLAGNNRTNRLDGGEGNDRIVGRRGADYIEGGRGRNLISAGPGADQIDSVYRPSDYGAEQIFCGSGGDNVSWIFPSDFLNDDCENLEFNFLREGGLFGGAITSLLPLRKPGTRGVLVAPELWCYSVVNPSGCQLRLELLVHGPATRRGTTPPQGTLLGSRSYTFAADERKSARLGLSAAGAKILRRHRTLRVRVKVTEDHAHQPGGYLTLLRAP